MPFIQMGLNPILKLDSLLIEAPTASTIPLIIKGAVGQSVDLIQLKDSNDANKVRINVDGFISCSGIANIIASSNSLIFMDTNGVIISRNIPDSNPSLIANQANVSSTGDIFSAQFAGTPKAIIDYQGNFKPSGYQSSDASQGVSGSFTTTDAKTVTVKDGIITAIV